MEPVTMYLLASAAVSGIQLAYNWWAGNQNLDREGKRMAAEKATGEARLSTQEAFIRQNDALRKQGIASEQALVDQQLVQGQNDLSRGVASTAAGLAQSGVFGPMAGMVTQQTQDQGQGKLDQYKTNAAARIKQEINANDLQFAQGMDSLANNRADIATGYQNGVDEIQAQRDQLNMDTLFGAAGVTLSAAGAIVKDPGFGKVRPSWSPSSFSLQALDLNPASALDYYQSKQGLYEDPFKLYW